MTFYAMGSEPPHLTPTNSMVTTAGKFDSNYSRGAALIQKEQGATLLSPVEVDTDWWVSCYYVANTAGVEYQSQDAIRCFTSSGAAAIYVKTTLGKPILRLVTTDGTTYNSATASTAFFGNGSLLHLVVHCYQDSDVAKADLYINAVLICSVQSASGKQIRPISSLYIQGACDNTNLGDRYAYCSEAIIANESLIGARLKTIIPSADGAETDFSGSYASVDELTLGSDFIFASGPGLVSTYQNSGYTGAVRAVGVALGASAGTGTIEGVLRLAGTLYTKAVAPDPIASVTAVTAIWEQNPNTEEAFVAGDLTSFEFGVKSVSAS